jgi:integrase
MTIEAYVRRLKQLSQLCNLNDPESVKAVISSLMWKNSTKETVVNAVRAYYKWKKITWEAPKYKPKQEIPFIPLEQELDTLIAAAKKRTAAALQFLKETGMRHDELMQLKVTDLDTVRHLINVHPAKGSNPRLLPISDKAINMINAVKRDPNNPHLFQLTKKGLRTTLESMRKRTAALQGNPRLKQIHLHTFRHYKGTLEYHKTHDIYHVMKVLGHKNIKNTLIYITVEGAIWTEQNCEYVCKAAETIDECLRLAGEGYQKFDEIDGKHLYRKRK